MNVGTCYVLLAFKGSRLDGSGLHHGLPHPCPACMHVHAGRKPCHSPSLKPPSNFPKPHGVNPALCICMAICRVMAAMLPSTSRLSWSAIRGRTSQGSRQAGQQRSLGPGRSAAGSPKLQRAMFCRRATRRSRCSLQMALGGPQRRICGARCRCRSMAHSLWLQRVRGGCWCCRTMPPPK